MCRLKDNRGSSNRQLRRDLQRILDENSDLLIGNQITMIANLSKVLSHRIKLESEAKIGDDKSWRYNCFTYAFRLLDSSEYRNITKRYSFLFPNSTFVSYVIAHHLTQIEQNAIKDNDYAIYLLSDKPQHAGKIRKDKVVSKWGMYHVWEHDIWEVPIQYGDCVRFFRQISLEDRVSAFKSWVDSRSHL